MLLATGGSGGHIYPALRVAEELKAAGHEVIFAGKFGAFKPVIQEKNFRVFETVVSGWSGRSLFGLGRCGYLLIRSLFQAKEFLRCIKADRIIGFGSYASFPFVFMGSFSGIPVLLHEQNVRPGKANCCLIPFARKVAISFKASEAYFPTGKTVLTGCPCQTPDRTLSREELQERFQLETGRLTILVFGGSQGSRTVNQVFLDSISLVKDQRAIQVIHLTGPSDYEWVKARYQAFSIPCYVQPFSKEIMKLYSCADLVICRAGAVTITEIVTLQKKAIMIPYPHADGHQNENAGQLAEFPMFRKLEERELNARSLADAVIALTQIPVGGGDWKKVEEKLFFPNAAQRIAQAAVAFL